MAIKRLDLRRRPRTTYTPADVERAAADLSNADLKRLRATAHALMTRLRLDGGGRDYDDLVSEALSRTLDGSRGWRHGVDFLYHLGQTMRSIAWTWMEREVERRETAAAEQWQNPPPGVANDENAAVLERLATPEPDAARQAIAREEAQAFVEKFADDAPASAVLAGWAIGSTGPEIRRLHGLSEEQLRAAIRRIRRFAQRGVRHD